VQQLERVAKSCETMVEKGQQFEQSVMAFISELRQLGEST
jgi:hypothetical protein